MSISPSPDPRRAVHRLAAEVGNLYVPAFWYHPNHPSATMATSGAFQQGQMPTAFRASDFGFGDQLF
jgi:hypothetical protein